MSTSGSIDFSALENELQRQERELEALRAFAEANSEQLVLGEEFRERMGVLVEAMNRRTSVVSTPQRGIAI